MPNDKYGNILQSRNNIKSFYLGKKNIFDSSTAFKLKFIVINYTTLNSSIIIDNGCLLSFTVDLYLFRKMKVSYKLSSKGNRLSGF